MSEEVKPPEQTPEEKPMTPIKAVVDDQVERLKDIQKSEKKNPNHGGARPGAGFPRGKKKKKTLEAMKVKAALQQRIMQHADDLFNAQFDLAVGEKVIMAVRTTGKGKNRKRSTEMVTDRETIKKYIDWQEADGDDPSTDEVYYYMTVKPANNQAIDSLMNRALGKVPDKLELETDMFDKKKLIIEVVDSANDTAKKQPEQEPKPTEPTGPEATTNPQTKDRA